MEKHYSQVLRDQIKERDKIIKDKDGVVNKFIRFMESPKFHCGDELDRMINISDVNDWLEQIKEIGLD